MCRVRLSERTDHVIDSVVKDHRAGWLLLELKMMLRLRRAGAAREHLLPLELQFDQVTNLTVDEVLRRLLVCYYRWNVKACLCICDFHLPRCPLWRRRGPWRS